MVIINYGEYNSISASRGSAEGLLCFFVSAQLGLLYIDCRTGTVVRERAVPGSDVGGLHGHLAPRVLSRHIVTGLVQ